MESYQLVKDSEGNTREDMVIALPDGIFIPNNPDNSDWKNYQLWLDKGNTPLPPEQPPIDDRRTSCLIKLAAKRDEIINNGIVVNEKPFFTDADSISLMHQALSLQGLGIKTIFPRTWILSDGSILNVTYDDIKVVAVAIADKKDLAYGNYMKLMVEIDSSDNPESIDINQGWPQ